MGGRLRDDRVPTNEVLAGGRFLHDFKFEMQFLASKDVGQVELPKLPGEPKSCPTLIEIHEKFHTNSTP